MKDSKILTYEDVPKEVLEAAILVARWMLTNGHDSWQLMNVCSRDHAWKLEEIGNILVCDKYHKWSMTRITTAGDKSTTPHHPTPASGPR